MSIYFCHVSVNAFDTHSDDEYDASLDQLFIDGVDAVTGKNCFVDLSIEGLKVKVKLDTGVQVSVIPFSLYRELQRNPTSIVHRHSQSIWRPSGCT